MHRVLIVDDERLIADTLVVIFEQHGYEARAAYSAEQALELLSAWSPDLALVDVILPKMDGIALAIFLKAEHPSCKIKLLSGRAATTNLLEAETASGHAFDVMAKPVHPTILLDIASQLFGPATPLQAIAH